MSTKAVRIGIGVLLLAGAAACRSKAPEEGVIRVGATPVPHAELLEVARPIVEAQGFVLKIVEFTDYMQPNAAVWEGDLDANFFQHQPYLDGYNAQRGARLVSVAKVHVEPLGIYSRKVAALSELPEGAEVALPNDPTNAGRALRLLENASLLRLAPGVESPTVHDVTENPRKLKLRELESAQLPRALPDVHAAVINTNFALEAGLVPARDALAREEGDSPYANVLVVREDRRDRPAVRVLSEALRSPEIKAFIQTRYEGAIEAAF